MWRQWRSLLIAVRAVTTLSDHPDRIARGSAAGMMCAYLPMVGQTVAGMALAWLVRGAPLAAVPWSWITNPFTTLPIWYACYRLGVALLPGRTAVGWDELSAAFTRLDALPFWDALAHGAGVLGVLYLPMLLGSLVVGLATALPTWYLIRRWVISVQAARRSRAAAWRARLAPGLPDVMV